MMGFGMMGGMLVFWVIIIVLAVLLVKGLFGNNGAHAKITVQPPNRSLTKDMPEVRSPRSNTRPW